jgi:energy-converting hydrogenase Eha subunit A
MNSSQLYILVAIVILAIVAGLAFVFRKKDRPKSLSPLASLAFACVVAGIVFGDNRLLGYALMAVGVILAVIDAFTRRKSA